MEKYFKSDEELKVYLETDVADSEYTGAFKTKEAARKYFLKQGMPVEDQEWIDNYDFKKDEHNRMVVVNWNVNEPCKNRLNSELNWPKTRLIEQLSKCTTKTPEKTITSLLEEIFCPWPSYDGHLRYIAQTYTPRVINWVISSTVKLYNRGGIKKNPAAYFTYRIQFRTKRKIPKRKNLIGTNDTR